MICGYGCGKEAKFPPRKGMTKWCCESNYNKCPEKRRENSESHKLTIEQFQEKYKTFAKKEEMRYNPDKPGEKEIQVHCKYHKCKNSKEKDGWFTPTYNQLKRRADALDHDDGNDGCFFYCPDECKQKCCLYHLRSDPNRLSEFEKYSSDVIKETYKIKKKFYNKIENIELQGKEHGYELDHKYSIYDGFINNVDPKIIAHYKNLQVVTIEENRQKSKNSSITLEELLSEINLVSKGVLNEQCKSKVDKRVSD